ncbi:MAG: histidinol dehydrogenase [Eubacterium sp.]|nr:histidinol dehydrogenase [Eubacterium sp.]
MKIYKANEETKKDILKNLAKRSPSLQNEFQGVVNEVLSDVFDNGDEAIIRLTEKYDKVKLSADGLRVSEGEIKAAYDKVDDKLTEVIKRSCNNIKDFHEKQIRQSFITTDERGIMLGQRITPIEKVGVYVPGGRAPLSSSVLMNIVPAVVAGVDRIVMATPPGPGGEITPEILVAADIAGADEIYKMGGAQAVAALAYGTETIPKVDKIVGPGNIFVTLAKKTVYGTVGIDSVAGPSEILVLADKTADPEYVACDLLSQAEHDPMASAILVTTDEALADKVLELTGEYAKRQSRREIIEKSLESYGYIIVADSMEAAIDIVNDIASEHLEIMTEDPFETMTKIRNAGAIFLGENSCEPLGDYFAGPNHVLPTNGTARFSSPLSVDEFIKKTSLISYSRSALEGVHEDIIAFAKAERLTAHANAIAKRFGKEVLDVD